MKILKFIFLLIISPFRGMFYALVSLYLDWRYRVHRVFQEYYVAPQTFAGREADNQVTKPDDQLTFVSTLYEDLYLNNLRWLKQKYKNKEYHIEFSDVILEVLITTSICIVYIPYRLGQGFFVGIVQTIKGRDL